MTSHLEQLENAVTPLGGYVEQLGGNLTGWVFQIANAAREYALITYYEGDHEGDPDAAHWMVGLYDNEGQNSAEDQFKADVTFADALAQVAAWRADRTP